MTELDGFLTGLVVCPENVPTAEWMTVVWGVEADGLPPFEDPLDVQWFANAVAARRDEIARDLARGRLQPILDVDERDGEILWEYWVDGFAEAMSLRPDALEALTKVREASAPWSCLKTLIEVARDESDLDSVEINALQDRAVTHLVDAVQRLYAASTVAASRSPTVAVATTAAKPGRNDPCLCGSGKKRKRCCA